MMIDGSSEHFSPKGLVFLSFCLIVCGVVSIVDTSSPLGSKLFQGSLGLLSGPINHPLIPLSLFGLLVACVWQIWNALSCTKLHFLLPLILSAALKNLLPCPGFFPPALCTRGCKLQLLLLLVVALIT